MLEEVKAKATEQLAVDKEKLHRRTLAVVAESLLKQLKTPGDSTRALTQE